ncbi:MAG: hypothetical protein L6Q63_02595 [Giesbergeria sp.]|nr:hypothetical protein [Giesbergeria sp.]
MDAQPPRLPLDPRQRAMLQEMGVRLWLPGDGSSGDRPAAPPAVRPRAAPQIPATSEPQRSAATSVPTRPAAVPTNTAQATPTGTAAAEHALLRPPRALYPDADPAQCPPALGNAWLLVAEGVHGSATLAEQAERLLDNMLRALCLHQHPQVHLCTLELAPSGPAGAGVDAALADAVAQLAPAVVLVMGRAAVRHCLGRSEPLGQLRGQSFTLAGVPAVVTFDAPVLLRSPGLKPAAWEDLCRARALAAATA